MAYEAKQIPVAFDEEKLRALADWAYGEFKELEQNFFRLDRIRLVTLFVEPAKRRDGDVVLADGTSWDPGSGAGFYGYYGAAWHKLG